MFYINITERGEGNVALEGVVTVLGDREKHKTIETNKAYKERQAHMDMGTKQTAQKFRLDIQKYIFGEEARTKKQVIGWAIINLYCSRRYATDVVEAYIDSGMIKEHEGFLVGNGGAK